MVLLYCQYRYYERWNLNIFALSAKWKSAACMDGEEKHVFNHLFPLSYSIQSDSNVCYKPIRAQQSVVQTLFLSPEVSWDQD